MRRRIVRGRDWARDRGGVMLSEKAVGYGVLRNGKPAGIWPVSESQARETAQRYLEKDPDDSVEVVPVSHGLGVRVLPLYTGR